MSIEVNGHQLPPLLVTLIEDGKWVGIHLPEKALNRLLIKCGLAPIVQDMITFAAFEMQEVIDAKIHNPEGMKESFEKYNIGSSVDTNHSITDEGMIDFDKAVFIAHGQDNMLCLDYRENLESPAVRAYIPQDGEMFVDWRRIAPDFETFARELGLVE